MVWYNIGIELGHTVGIAWPWSSVWPELWSRGQLSSKHWVLVSNGARQKKMRRTTLIETNAQRVAAALASKQAMRVSWKRFCEAQEEYIRWEAFALWTRAVVEAQGGAPHSLLRVLKKRCVGFIEQRTMSREPKLLALRLHEWIQDRIFIAAKQEGWLDALHFYGVRGPRCEGAWAYWEYCQREWKHKRRSTYPGFETWWRSAQNYNLFQKVTAARAADVVDTYVDWLAFAHWLRPLMGGNLKSPNEVARELQRRCPDFAPEHLTGRPKEESWQSFVKHFEGRFFSIVSQQHWLDYVREKAYNHPRHVRTIAYSDHWLQEWFSDPTLPYPPFPQWQQAADDFIEKSP